MFPLDSIVLLETDSVTPTVPFDRMERDLVVFVPKVPVPEDGVFCRVRE